MQPESPKAPPTPNAEGKEGTPKKQKQCNCKHSRCLKLYCECFASGIDCDGCNCVNCHNNIDNEPARRGAMESLLERYPYAFRPKIAQSLHGRRDNVTAPAVAPAPTPVVVFPPPQQQHVLGHMQPESPKAPPRPNDEGKEGTPKKQKQCNCKPSRCLKLYCECFASGVYYDGCNCVNCHNNVDNEPARRDAIESILERNPQAFRPFITNSPHGECDNREETGEVAAKHNKGCHCKKSGCLKRSCESFHANIHCSENCKCMDCKNFEGSPEREAIFLDPIHDVTSFQESASAAAITESVGSSSYGEPLVGRKRRPE